MERFSIGCADAMLAELAKKFQNGIIAIYTGSQPVSAEKAENGTLKCLITNNGGTFVPGQPGNGLNFGTPANGEMDKASGERWIGNAISATSGDLGWFRFYANDYITGESYTALRFDGKVGTTSSDAVELLVEQTTLNGSDAFEVLSFKIRFV